MSYHGDWTNAFSHQEEHLVRRRATPALAITSAYCNNTLHTFFYCKLDTNGVIRTYKQAENSPKLSISEDEAVMASSSGSVLPGQVRAHLCL